MRENQMKKLIYTVEQIAFLHPKSLEDDRLKGKEYHYYFIASTPLKYIEDIRLIDNAFIFSLSDINGNMEVSIQVDKSKYTIKNFTWKYRYSNDKVSALLSYKVYDNNGDVEEYADIEYASNDVYYFSDKIKEFKIEYIGQAYAQNGNRTAQDRLLSHQTLQKILADIDRNRDIRLFLLGVDIASVENETSTGEETPVFNVCDVDGYEASYVNLFEAYLINTFKPTYNKNFVNGKVPSISHESYKKVIEKSYDEFNVVFAIENCESDYVFFTESKSLQISNGIIDTSVNNGVIDIDAIKVSFDDINKIYDKDYKYSFNL